jgi:hypothetical protein
MFFAFTENILKSSTQEFILSRIQREITQGNDDEMKTDTLPYEVINCMNEQGYTPYLTFIRQFSARCEILKNTLNVILNENN